ncbi:cation:proton antiporter domain-containing protein [Amycolatopsis pigmentata]|uniref:Cation:proton antiporter n=1 Tax=Amycolatopsis pigmentata TaxID=450801 RepID=A0ABW5FSR6_9PSEU
MTSQHVVLLMLALAAILVLTRLFGALARLLRQPKVIGEILAGIVLGPLLLHGAVGDALVAVDIRPHLAGLADIGLALFMFLVGSELDGNPLRGTGKAAALVSSASMLVPFGLGCLLALTLVHSHPAPSRTGLVLFMGVALSVTAFPVLARILTDHGIIRTPLGKLALSCAALADILAWVMLAVVVALVGGSGRSSWSVVLVVPYTGFLWFVARPLLAARSRRNRSEGELVTVALGTLLLSSAFTEWIGLHFIFGAFLAGVVMPKEITGTILRERLRGVADVLFLPVYFVIAGLQVDLTAIGDGGLGELALIVVVAAAGKFVSTLLAARASGVPRNEARVLAVLMNTRGLTELVILTVGSQLGLLDRALYSMLVVMALVTTAMTGLLLRLVLPSTEVAADVGLGRQRSVAAAGARNTFAGFSRRWRRVSPSMRRRR